MTDVDPTSILRDRYEALAARRIELRAELDPLELELAKLQAGLRAMGALDIPEVLAEQAMPPAKLWLLPGHDPVRHPDLEAEVARLLPRVRHPDLQAAIDQQSPSVAIPRETKLYCREGCVNGDAGGFADQMALRTHTKRRHDREPTEQEQVPR